MHGILEKRAPLPEAIEANLHGAWIHLGRALGATVHDEPELLWFHSGLPFHLANGVVQTRFPRDMAEETLKRRLKQLTARQVSMAWLIGPSTRPADLGERLAKHGWFHDDEAPGMAVDLHTLGEHSLLPPQLTIEQVNDRETLNTWVRVMSMGSGLRETGLAPLLDITSKQRFDGESPVRCYLGRLSSRPVATSLLYLGAGVAGVYNVATLPEARRQGIGKALTLAPLLDARAQGYHIGALQSSPMGLNIYRRLGFREYCIFHAYFWQGK